MQHGVIFEVEGIRKHSNEWGLWFMPYSISYPEVKKQYTEILGGDGSVDQTEIFGKIYYKDRQFQLEFTCEDKKRFDLTVNEIVNFVHGKKAKIIIYDNPNYYYIGRVSVNEYTSSQRLGTITIDVVAEPYLYKNDLTVIQNSITESQTIAYPNSRMETIPTFKSDKPIHFEFNSSQYSLNGEATMFPNVVFKQGNNTIKWTGTANVEVSYQEGTL